MNGRGGTHSNGGRKQRRSRYLVWLILGVTCLLIVALLLGLAKLSSDQALSRDYLVAQEFWLCRLLEIFFGTWVFVVGSCIASFLNVVAYRVPAGLPITGISFCPHCRVPIRPSDNVPILGWIRLGGRCRTCKLKISPRYPLFEFIGGLILLSVFLSTLMSQGANLPWHQREIGSYGLPLNLQQMEPSLFRVAGLHAGLLLVLYAAAMTSFSGGQLPVRIWWIGAVAVLVAIGWYPELVMLPMSLFNEQGTWSCLVGSSRAAAWNAAIVGGVVGVAMANVPNQWTERASWLGACGLIGLTLGWQAIVVIALASLTMQVVCFRKGSGTLNVWQSNLVLFTSKVPYPHLRHGHPVRWLWLWTAIFSSSGGRCSKFWGYDRKPR